MVVGVLVVVRLAVEAAATPRAREVVPPAVGVIPEVAAGAQVLRRLRGKGIALLADQDSVRPFATSWDYLRPPKRK